MRRNSKIDSTQPAIIKAYRSFGVSVQPTHMIGGDFPDLICALQLRTWLTECKDGTLPPSKRKLSPGQQEFRDEWCGIVFTVLSADEVPAVIDTVLNLTEINEALRIRLRENAGGPNVR